MLRTCLKHTQYRGIQKTITINIPQKYSTSENLNEEIPNPPKKRWFGKIVALTLVGSAGVIGYTWINEEFRKSVEDTIPYSKEALNYLFQYLQVLEDYKKRPKDDLITEKKPINYEVKDLNQLKESNIKSDKELPKSATTVISTAVKSAKDLANEKKLLEKKKAEEELKRREEEESKLNKDLESTLFHLLSECQSSVNKSISSFNSSTESVRAHVQKLKLAMESKDNSEKEWEQVVNLFEAKSDNIKQAVVNSERAKIKLEELKHAIGDGKENKITKKNKQLQLAEEEFAKLSYSFNSAAAKLSKAQSDHKVFSEYRDLVKKSREQFKKEIESIVPESKKSSGSKLNEEELNSLIAHAHRRIEQIQKQLAEQQTMEGMRMGEALDIQKNEDTKLAQEMLDIEKERWNLELDMMKQKWSLEAQVQFEEDLRNQLSRQAAAHNDHLGDVLKIQKLELEAQFADLLIRRLDDENREFELKVASWVARLRGIETAIDSRANLEKEGCRAQKLWIACSGLQSILKNGNADGSNWQEKMIPLGTHIQTIKDLSENDLFVQAIISALPEQAITRGVWTPSALTDRFDRVALVCRRVALIDERGGSLAKYFLSFIQSWFVFSRPVYASNDVIDDLSELGAFRIVDNAKASVSRGDLLQAVRFMNQLTGEARRLASDWLLEAKLTLEVSQAIDTLLAHASASGILSLPLQPLPKQN